MQFAKLLGLSAAMLIGVSTLAFAADPPAATDPKVDTKNTRLIKPWSDLKDLTADQTEKLKVIHRKYLDEVKVLEAKQTEESNAVLTDAQKKEMAAIEAAAKKGAVKPPATPAADTKTGASTGADTKATGK